jgi:hypothetical protein
MIDDRDVWAAALLMVKRYGDDAMLEASERADEHTEDGDSSSAADSRRPASGLTYSNGTAAPVIIKSLDEVLD